MDSSTVWTALPAIAAIIVRCILVVEAAMGAAVDAQVMGQVVTGPGQVAEVRAVAAAAAGVDSDEATATESA